MNKPAAGELFWNFHSFRSNFGGVSTFSGGVSTFSGGVFTHTWGGWAPPHTPPENPSMSPFGLYPVYPWVPCPNKPHEYPGRNVLIGALSANQPIRTFRPGYSCGLFGHGTIHILRNQPRGRGFANGYGWHDWLRGDCLIIFTRNLPIQGRLQDCLI